MAELPYSSITHSDMEYDIDALIGVDIMNGNIRNVENCHFYTTMLKSC